MGKINWVHIVLLVLVIFAIWKIIQYLRKKRG